MRKHALIIICLGVVFLCACITQNSTSGESFYVAAKRLAWDINLQEDASYVYYKNDTGIWKYNKKTGMENLILEEGNVCHIELEEDTLYFMSGEEFGDKCVYELMDDGSKKLICDVDDYGNITEEELGQNPPPLIKDFFVHNNIFYFPYYMSGIICYDPTSKEASVFNNDIAFFALIDDKFYNTGFRKELYQERNFIKETYLIDGEQRQLYTTEKNAMSQLVITSFGDVLYFSNESNQLCKYSAEKGIEKIYDLSSAEEITSIAFPEENINDKLYYLVERDDTPCSLYVYNPATGESRVKIEKMDFLGWFTVFHDVLIYVNGEGETDYISL